MSDTYTVATNTGAVEQAVASMGTGDVNQVEERAKAKVIHAEIQSGKVAALEDDQRKQSGGTSPAAGNSEAKVYTDILIDAAAPGLRMVSTVADFIGARHQDHADFGGGATQSPDTGAGKAVQMDKDIMSMQAPGVYRSPMQQRAYDGAGTSIGGTATAAVSAPAFSGRSAAKEKISGEAGIIERANITETSLKGQGPGALASWDVPDKKLASVAEAKRETFQLRNSSDLALESVAKVRNEHSAMLYQAQQLSPPGMNLSLANGPSIHPERLLSEAKQNQDSQSA